MSQYPNYFGHNTQQPGQATYNNDNPQPQSYPASTAASNYQQPPTASGHSFASTPWYPRDGNQRQYGSSVTGSRTSGSDNLRNSSVSQNYDSYLANSGYVPATDITTRITTYRSNADTTRHTQAQYPVSHDCSQPVAAYASQSRTTSISSGRTAKHQRQSPSVHDRQPHAQKQYVPPARVVPSSITRSASPAQVQASRSLQNLSHGYADQRSTTRTLPSIGQPTSAMSQPLYPSADQSATTVDPAQDYDPWAQHQRRLEAARANGAENTRLAKEAEAERLTREAEAKRLAHEKGMRKQAQEAEARRLGHETEARQLTQAAEAKRLDDERTRAKLAEAECPMEQAQKPSEPKKKKLQKQEPDEVDEVAQLRALMARMREKNPDLLAQMLSEHWPSSSPAPPSSASPPTQPPRSPPRANAPGCSQTASRPTTQKEASAPSPSPALPSPVVPTSTPNPPQKPPAPKRQGTTVWPTEKKGRISEAAAQYLTDIPANSGRIITADQIRKLLDDNPSYIQLCDRLERMGLRLERGAFARTLLSSVPDADNSARPKPTAPEVGTSSAIRALMSIPSAAQATPSLPQAQSITSLPQPARCDFREPSSTAIRSPYYVNHSEPSLGAATPGAPTPSVGPSGAGSPASSKPDTKVTTLPKAIPLERPSSKAHITKEEAARKRDFSEIVDLSMLSSDEDEGPPLKLMRSNPLPNLYPGHCHPLPQSPETANGTFGTSGPIYEVPAVPMTDDPFMSNSYIPPVYEDIVVALPIDRKKALWRSHYNVKTIARDVLIATGKWPDLRPLNYHLEPLKRNVRQIDSNSDLRTINWNVLDPGQPDDLQEDSDSVISDADDEADSTRRLSVLVRREQRPDIPADSAKPPDHVNPPPSPGRTPRPKPSSLPNQHFDRYAAPLTTKPPTMSGSMGYAAFRAKQVDEHGNPVKKMGRPVGWRKHLHSKAAQQGALATSQGAVPPPSIVSTVVPSASPLERVAIGRVPIINPRLGQPPQQQPSSAHTRGPDRLEFACEWEGCAAKLHNLATLRRHALKAHGAPDASGDGHKFTCLWKGCGSQPWGGTDRAPPLRLVFRTFSLFWQHVDDSHLTPMRWTHGDGPASGVSDYDELSDVYLSDSHGRQVTPRIVASAEAEEPTPATTPAEARARESVRAMERKKATIGVGVDRGGATLANEKRRAGFMDDEEFEVDVDSE